MSLVSRQTAHTQLETDVRIRLGWLSIAVSVTVAACTVGENYRRPDIAAPAAFRGTAREAQADSTSLADMKWFEVFKDQQLQELIRTALVRSHDARDAAARVEAARAALGITRSDQFPTVEGSASVATVRSSASGTVPLPEGVDQTHTFGTVGLSLLSFELDLWGRLRRATEAARADLLAAEYNRKTVMTMLVSDVASAYFNLLELDMELAIAKRTLGVRAESLELIRNRERGGLGTLLDVRQGEQLVYGAEQVIPAIEQLIEQTENQISLLLGGAPHAIPRDRPLEEQQQPPAVPAGLPSSLLDRRPDIQAAEQNLVAANAIVGVARAAYFPRISLTGLLGFQSDQLAGLFSGPARVWQFVPQVTQPIFNAGRLRSNVNFAKAQQELTLIQYDRVIQTAFREVSDVLVQHQKVREIRGKQELLVDTLRDRARMSRVRYAGGIDPLLNALDAERDLFSAELTLVQTRRNELLAVVELYRALGGGWQQ
jgi:outer membrane protein, multidrug efflux system